MHFLPGATFVDLNRSNRSSGVQIPWYICTGFLALFVPYWVKLNNERGTSFTVSYFLQRVCTDIVEIFTKSNMVVYHDCVQDLVSEVTFRKVESMLQVTCWTNFININIIIIIIIVIIVIINIIIIILTLSSSSTSDCHHHHHYNFRLVLNDHRTHWNNDSNSSEL